MEEKQVFPLPRKPLGRTAHSICFSHDNVSSIRRIPDKRIVMRASKLWTKCDNTRYNPDTSELSEQNEHFMT